MRWQDYLMLLLLLVGAYLVYFIKQKRKPKARRRRSGTQLARREQGAWRKLQARGYRLEEIHPFVPVTITCDRSKKDFTHEGDFTVSKGGKTYLVKVKKGDGSNLSSPGLRRELLLDYLFFLPDGLFLYDGEKEQLQELQISLAVEGYGGGKEKFLWQAALAVLIIAGLAFLYRLVF